MNFLASPTVVTAMAFSGKLSFNPIVDSLEGLDGKPFKFTPPVGIDLPEQGFTLGMFYFLLRHSIRSIPLNHLDRNRRYLALSAPDPGTPSQRRCLDLADVDEVRGA